MKKLTEQEVRQKITIALTEIKTKRANNYKYIRELEHTAYCTLYSPSVQDSEEIKTTEEYKELSEIYNELKKELKEIEKAKREKRNAKRLLYIKELTPTIEKTIETVQEIRNSEEYDYDKANKCLQLLEDIKSLVVDKFNPDYDSKDEVETNATELEFSFMSLLHNVRDIDISCLYETTPQFAYNEYYGF